MRLTKTERILQIFTEVRPGEGPTALLMFSNVFLILCAYYFIKPLREGWIAVSDISGLSKMEVKAYSSFAQSVFLLLIVGWYGRLAERWDRSKLITRATLFCISNMVIFWFLQPGYFIDQLPASGIVFYLWVGMFGVFVVAQFWTFCADIYTNERGKRLLPMIAIGATSGAAAGSWIVDLLVDSGLVPTEALLLVATLPLFASILLTRLVDARQRSAATALGSKSTQPPSILIQKGLGFLMSGAKLIFFNRFMLAAAIVTLLTNWVNTNGENLLFQVVQDTLSKQAVEQGVTDEQSILEFTRNGTTAFYGNFFFWVNIIALLLQSFIASRMLKLGGFGAILMILPVIALVSYTMMALLPILAIVKMMKIAENATDYSLNNTARHVLWLPIDTTMKFQGKPAIDTLYVRVGDGLAAITVLVGVQFLALSVKQFFIFNVSLVLLWLIFGILLVREHGKASTSDPSGIES
ncbi:MAG: NTP/NDP exchange transporter [Gammaproteobacteria bacterium]